MSNASENPSKGIYLLIADSFYPCKLPPESRTNTYLAEQLSNRGWCVVIWAPSIAEPPPTASRAEVVHRGKKWGVWELFRLIRWIRVHRPSRIALMYDVTEYSLRPTVTWIPLIAKFHQIPCATQMTNGVQPYRSSLQNIIVSALGFKCVVDLPIGPLAASERLMMYSEADKDALIGRSRSCPASVTIVSPPAVGIFSRLSRQTEHNASLFVIGFFGLIYPSKGLEWLIEALAYVKSGLVPVRLSIIGQGGGITSDEAWNLKCRQYETQLHELANKLGVQDLIQWHGFQPDDKAAELVTKCNLVCLPFDEGLTGTRSSFVECAKAGIPIVTTLGDSTDQYLKAPNSGITFVPPKSPQAIAKAISDLLTHPPLCRELAEQIKKFGRSIYTDQFVDEFDY